MKYTTHDGSILIVDGMNAEVQLNDEDKTVLVLDAAIVMAMNSGLFDADGAVFLQRQLEHIKAKSYEVQYPELKARSMFAVNNEGGPGITSITYRVYDQVGSAAIINAYAKDLPRVDIKAREVTIPVRSVADAYGYSVDEINSAALVGMPLDARKAQAGIRAAEQTVNSVAFFGDAESGMPGFFDNPNIPKAAVVNPGSGTEFVNKTADQILFDINDLCADVFELTNGVEQINKLALPPGQWAHIMQTPRATNSDTSIAKYVAANSPFLNSVEDIVWLNECDADHNPTLSTDAMVAYNNAPDKIQLEIPHEFEWFPAQPKGLEFEIPGRLRLAGLNIYTPLSCAIGTGI